MDTNDYHYRYHDDDDDDEMSIVNIFKYMIICTISLLIIGLITLFIRHLFLIQNSIDQTFLLCSYSITFIIILIKLLAIFKEHFFFLIITAILNILLAILSMTIQSYRWSIILLQIISSLFTFSYLLSMYLKMKLDILHKRRLQQRLEELQTSNMMKRRFLVTSTTLDENVDDHIYQIAPSIKPPPEFNPIELTNEWIINHNHNHQNNNSMLLQQNPENEQNEFDSKRIISTPTTNSI